MSAPRGSKRLDGDAPVRPLVRCAIYTRKSTEEGLEQEFNSLDAQREAAEAYIASQKHEGWVCIPDRYDDGGFSGGTMDRPALRRLLADIEAGKVDNILVYKVDRLSRSILDFWRIVETLDRRSVSFTSVTQQFSTSTSSGRLFLSILISFAQHERELISERTRDKMSAARRKGKWVGGMQILGYDVAGGRLVVNKAEAEKVRAIFALYLERQSTIEVLRELARRRWRMKRWVTRKGEERGGKPFDKPRLLYMLRNAAYVGEVHYDGQVYDGEHEAIVDPEVWGRVQKLIGRNGATSGGAFRNKHGALLKGILRCAPCDAPMTATYTSKDGKRYRYYVCIRAQKKGWAACPTKSVSAGEVEQFVVDQLRVIGTDPALAAKVLEEARAASQGRVAELDRERREVERDMRRAAGEIRKLVGRLGGGKAVGADSPVSERMADLQDQVRAAEERERAIREELVALEAERIDEHDLAAALERFDPVWEALSPREQARVVHLLVERVAYDGAKGAVAVTFRPAGIKALAGEAP